jgi:FSR family fosmidomycin resistance protein-like MFS transporter
MGLLLSGIPFAFLVVSNNFMLISAALVVSGIGVGMYHPVAAVVAGRQNTGTRPGFLMAFFAAGGTAGFIVAPFLVVVIVQFLGSSFLPLIVIPALVGAILFATNRTIDLPEGHGYSYRQWISVFGEYIPGLFVLWLISSMQSMVNMLMGSFLPMLLMARGFSYSTSVLILALQLTAGMIGMLIGGYLADVHGRRRIMAVTLFLTSPLLFGFLHTSGIVSLILLMLGTGAVFSTIPINIVIAQRTAPALSGMASSLVMGLSFVIGALMATPFGMLADRIGIENAMNAPLVLPFIAAFGVFLIKKE